jgi:hypothetical protein
VAVVAVPREREEDSMQITITKVERIEATDRHMNEIEGHM